MKLILSFSVTLLFFSNLYSQDSLKVGEKAPQIHITDYILNSPKVKNIDNKFLVLEFWATWCAPCVGAVPHLNELQKMNKSQKDLLFISITNEKPEKVKKTLERIEFKTMVVSDQTKKTEVAFNVTGVPFTVLIDNKGVIKWLGYPNELNQKIIENFINGKVIVSDTPKVVNEEVASNNIEKKEGETLTDISLKILKDKNTRYIFNLMEANKNDYSMAVNALSRGRYIEMNNSLKSILSKIINKPESEIIITDSLDKIKFNLLYKNTNGLSEDKLKVDLKANLINALNLKETIEVKNIETYNLKIIDSTKINVSVDEDDTEHSGNNDTHFIFSNSRIQNLIKILGDYSKTIINNETRLEKKYDFIIRRDSLMIIIKDLESYGLTLEKVIKSVEFYNYR
jgi:thiol-disulfide isomerase/thioredoxin